MLAKIGNHRQGRDATGLRILGRNVFDRHREARGIRLHLDTMGIARQCGIRPDFKPGPIRADSGKRERDGDIEVSRESPGSFARRAVEDLQRLGDAFNVDIVLDNVGRRRPDP